MSTLPLQSDVGLVPISEALMVASWFALSFGAMGVAGIRLRAGKLLPVRRAADWLEARTGIAGWAALPVLITFVALIVGSGGLLWDVNQHIENGRDLGLISQPSHVLAVIGLTTMVCASFLSLVLPVGQPGASAVRIARTWHVPAAGLTAFIGFGTTILIFPLDDLWHRIFGLDVSLWSPIHFVIVAAAMMGAVSTWFLMVAGAEAVSPGDHSRFARALKFLFPSLLIILGPAMVDEWSLGLPQAAPGYEPVLLATSVWTLVYLRLLYGRGATLKGWLVYVVLASALVGYVVLLGFSFTKVPVMIGYPVGVELAALLVGTAASWRFGLVAGLLGAGVGTLVEWGWGWLVNKPVPWEPYMLLDALPWILLAALGSGLLGIYVAHALAFDRAEVGTSLAGRTAVAGLLAIIASFYFVAGEPGGGGSAIITTTANAKGTALTSISVVFDPSSVGERTDWLIAGSYMGGGIEAKRLEQRADGSWFAEGEFPVTGTWKTTIRLSKDGNRSAVPVRMPADKELGLPEVPVEQVTTRAVVNDLELMQRERKPDTPDWLWSGGLGVCFALYAALLIPLCWALRRMVLTSPPVRTRTKDGASR